MYEELQVEGYLVDYERVPITDEKPPKELDFDILVRFHVLHSGLYLLCGICLCDDHEFFCFTHTVSLYS